MKKINILKLAMAGLVMGGTMTSCSNSKGVVGDESSTDSKCSSKHDCKGKGDLSGQGKCNGRNSCKTN